MKIDNVTQPFRVDSVKCKVQKFLAYCLLLTAYCLLPTVSYARLGGCTATFLSIGGGARALALGGAYSAFAEGIDAVYWNPAGIAELTRSTVNFTHANYLAGMSQENIGAVIPIPDGAIGISTIALLSGRIEETTPKEQMGTGRYWSANNFAVGLSYARKMTDKFSAGITIKGINQNIDKVSSNGFAFDVGGTYNTNLRGLKFGFIIQNFGADVAFSGEGLATDVIDTLNPSQGSLPGKLESEPDPLPLNFQLGVAVDLLATPLYKITLMGDLVHPSDQEATYALGTEFSVSDKYFARIGFTEKNNRGFFTRDEAFDWQIPDWMVSRTPIPAALGIGITEKFGAGEIIVDYTYEAHQHLSGIHRIGIGFAF